VLGFSLGGLVAQELTLTEPSLVRRLVLVGTGPRSGEGMSSLTPEAQKIFGATYDEPDHLWPGKTLPHEHHSSTQRKGKAMSEQVLPTRKTIKVPGPDHPITIEHNPNRIVVTVAGRVVADTRDAHILREASYPAVQYVPRKDVEMGLLERTEHATYCPYKGDCSYFSIPLGGNHSANAVWSYEAPYAAVTLIKDHLAFYPDRVDAIEERHGE
jgi:uncharacterized protein (DUF427 family)